MNVRWIGLVAAAPLTMIMIMSGCDLKGTAGTGDDPGRAVDTASADGKVHLEARFGAADDVFGEASWKVRPGKPSKFKVQLGGVEPGAQFAVALDGVPIGDMDVDLDGEGELEFEGTFPAGFPEPRAGSVITIGELFTVKLSTVEELANYVADIAGPFQGEVEFKSERIGARTVRELTIEAQDGPPDATYTVSLDGVRIGDLELDDEGEGDLAYMDGGEDPFPDGFREPRAGSVVRIGDVEVTLVDKK